MESIVLSTINLGTFSPQKGFVLGEMLRVMLGLSTPQDVSAGVQAGAIPAPDFTPPGASGTPQSWLWYSTTVAPLIANQADITSVQSAVSAWYAKFPLPV